MGEQESIPELIDILREGTEHLVKMAKGFEFPWSPTPDDPRKLDNMYARNLITAYLSKFADLSNGVLLAIALAHRYSHHVGDDAPRDIHRAFISVLGWHK